jgi:quinol monooxygenase YgiN
MITVKVSYGVKDAFVAKNKENIATFTKDFKAMGSEDFKYNVYTLDDNTTFVHISSYANEQVQKKVLSTPSFVEFQRQRDESGLVKAHHIVTLNHVASSAGD